MMVIVMEFIPLAPLTMFGHVGKQPAIGWKEYRVACWVGELATTILLK